MLLFLTRLFLTLIAALDHQEKHPKYSQNRVT